MQLQPSLLRLAPVLATALFALSCARPAREVPLEAPRHVDDRANLLSTAQRTELEGKLVGIKHESGRHVAVLTTNSLDGMTIEFYRGIDVGIDRTASHFTPANVR